MYVEYQVPECDDTGEQYQGLKDGVAVISQGATGRYCAVLYFGPEFKARLIENGQKIYTYEEAVEAVEAIPGAWVEF